MRGVAGELSDQPPLGGNDFASGPVLSPRASSASRAVTVPGFQGIPHLIQLPFPVAIRLAPDDEPL